MKKALSLLLSALLLITAITLAGVTALADGEYGTLLTTDESYESYWLAGDIFTHDGLKIYYNSAETKFVVTKSVDSVEYIYCTLDISNGFDNGTISVEAATYPETAELTGDALESFKTNWQDEYKMIIKEPLCAHVDEDKDGYCDICEELILGTLLTKDSTYDNYWLSSHAKSRYNYYYNSVTKQIFLTGFRNGIEYICVKADVSNGLDNATFSYENTNYPEFSTAYGDDLEDFKEEWESAITFYVIDPLCDHVDDDEDSYCEKCGRFILGTLLTTEQTYDNYWVIDGVPYSMYYNSIKEKIYAIEYYYEKPFIAFAADVSNGLGNFTISFDEATLPGVKEYLAVEIDEEEIAVYEYFISKYLRAPLCDHVDTDEDGYCNKCGKLMLGTLLTIKPSYDSYWIVEDFFEDEKIYYNSAAKKLVQVMVEDDVEYIIVTFDVSNGLDNLIASFDDCDHYEYKQYFEEMEAEELELIYEEIIYLINPPIPQGEAKTVYFGKDNITSECTDWYIEGGDWDGFEAKMYESENGNYLLLKTSDYVGAGTYYPVETPEDGDCVYVLVGGKYYRVYSYDAEEHYGYSQYQSNAAYYYYWNKNDDRITIEAGTQLYAENEVLEDFYSGMYVGSTKYDFYVEETDLNLVAPSHDYGEWTVTKEATCGTAGVKEKVCTRCTNKVTEEIPATGNHIDADSNGYCDVCNAEVPVEEEELTVIQKIIQFFQMIIDFFKKLFG